MLRLAVLVGGLKGKSLIDIGCGPARNKETEVLRILMELDISLSSYAGVDPILSPRLLHDREEGRLFLPASLYELDNSVFEGIGRFDIVFTCMFFGFPIGSSTHQLNWNILAGRGGHSIDIPPYGEIKEFIEFGAQERFRRLVKDGGWVAHFVLENEPGPNIEMA